MITCSITKNQQVKLAAILLKELEETKGVYDVNSTLRNIYSLVNNSQKNPGMALDYARLVPRFVLTMASWKAATSDLIADKYADINKLAKNFEADVKNVEDFFAINASDVQAAKNLQKGLEQEKFDPEKQPTPPAQTTSKSIAIEALPFVEITQEKYHPEEYRLEAGIRDRIIDAKPEEGKLVDLPGIGRVKLIAMSASKVPDSQRKPNELVYMEKLKVSGQSLAGDVYLFLVDTNDDIVYVTEDFERGGENTGKMVYYNIYKPTTATGEKKKTITESNPFIAQRLTYYKSLNNTAEQAEALVQREISNIENIRKYVNIDPATHKVEFHITGGAYKIQSGRERTAVPMAKLQGSTLVVEDVSGPTVGFKIEGVKPEKGKTLTAERNYYSPELADKIVSILFEDLTYDGKPIDLNTRIRLASQFVFFTARGLDVDIRSGKFTRLGKEISGTIEQQKDIVYKHLTAVLPGEDITAKQAEGKVQHFFQKLTTADYTAKVASGEIKVGHVLVIVDENNKPLQYRKIDQTRINMKKNLLSTNSYEDFDIVDGKVISKPNQPYKDFVINNSSVFYSVDNTGKLNTTPGYLNITPVAKSFEVATKAVETEAVEVPVDNNPITGDVTNISNNVTKEDINRTYTLPDGKLAVFKINNEKLNNLVPINGKKLFLGMMGRFFTLVKVGNKNIPFYISSDGTSGKQAGKWYPFFGTTSSNGNIISWIIKGSVKEMENGYGNADIKAAMDNLNTNLIIPSNFIHPDGTFIGDGKVLEDLKKHIEFGSYNLGDKWTENSSELNKNFGLTIPSEIIGHTSKGITKYIDSVINSLNQPNNVTTTSNTTKVLTVEEQLAELERQETEALKQQNKAPKNDDGSVRNKLFEQKELVGKATSTQNIEAKEWFDKTFKGKVSFKDLMHMANMSNPRSIATWQVSGITLYNGAEFSDLYHEAWHSFTQSFLDQFDKSRLYGETAKKTGTFKDYNGKTVKFSDATELQLEEFLAEDFRSYMLSGGKVAKGSPVRNSIFRRIVDFLKSIFGKTTLVELAADRNANKTIKEFYDQLRKGDLNGYTFSTENRNFDTLHKGLEAYTKDEPIRQLGMADSKLVVDTIDSLFSSYADAQNAGLTGTQFARKQALVVRYAELPDIGRTVEQEKEHAQIESELKELLGNQTYKNSTEIFETRDGLQKAYVTALFGLKRQNILLTSMLQSAKNKETPSESNVAELNEKLRIINYAINQFGNIEDVFSNTSGVVVYHMKNSAFVKPETIADILEEELDAQANEVGKNVYDRNGQDNSIAELAERDTEILLRSLHKVNKNGTKWLNRVGVPQLEDYRVSINRISSFCENITTIQGMKKSLEKNADLYPPIKQLLEKLGPIKYDGQTAREEDQWTKFWQTMNKYRVRVTQMNINKNENLDENGAATTPAEFEVHIGETGGDKRKVQDEWENKFSNGTSNAFLINKDRGNYLDLNRVIEMFPTKESIQGKEFEFLRAIGVDLKDDLQLKEELGRAIDRGEINVSALPAKIAKLTEVGYNVKSVGQVMGAYSALGLPSEFGNYNKLANLQVKYGGDVSDFMTTTATGNKISEKSLNNSITVLLSAINQAPDFLTLVQGENGEGGSMSFLAEYNDGQLQNPFLRSSVFMNAIFDFSKPRGPKRRNAQIVLENLSGISFLDNGRGTDNNAESFTADEVSRLIMEFHLQLMEGKPPVPQHADKTTTYTAYVNDLGLGNLQKNLFIDTYQFLPAGASTTKVHNIMRGYILSELARVKESRRLLESGDLTAYDFDYLKRGSNFTYFEDILTADTQNRLINQQTDDMGKFLNSDEGVQLSRTINEEVDKYFQTQYNWVSKQFNKQPFISEQLKTKVKDHAKSAGLLDVKDDELQNALLRSFVVNNWMSKYEVGSLLYGDLALYTDYNKRIASAASTGDLMRSDADWIQSVNERLGKPYAKSVKVDAPKYDGFIKTAVVGKIMIPSAYYDVYKEDLGEKRVEKYSDLEEADAQAFMSFDMYRIVSKSVSQWSTDQERVFNKIVNKEYLTGEDKEVTFPVLKMSYFGPLYNGNLSLRALHKFSLFPLIPNVIKGTNLEEIHNKMVKEDIGYLTFKSGSKVATVTKKSGIDKLYSNLENNEVSTAPYTVNRIHSDFLKMQIKPSAKVKKQISFFTQMRLMIDSGLIENGVPIDYTGGKDAWDNLSDDAKKEASPFYEKRTAFKDAVYQLASIKRTELLKEIGGTEDAEGNISVNMTKLLELVNRELSTRREMAEHELEFIQMKDGKLKWDLSLSPSGEQVEKILTAVINKRLVNYKVNGNELVMVAATGFEKKGHKRNFTKPTFEQLAKYGSDDLPTYHKRADGTIAAAKVKISMQNDFKKLLQLQEVRDKAFEMNSSRLEALNVLIKDEEWLAQGDNRRMISLVGARRPTQGLNSMEFVEVYEFLPETAGSIIILPSEITAKMGADFDYDKLPMMMPHLKVVGDTVVPFRPFSKEEVDELYKTLVDYNFAKVLKAGLNEDDLRKFFNGPQQEQLEDIMTKFFGENYIEDLKNIVFEDEKVPTLAEFAEQVNNPSKVAENKIQQSARELLELPANFKNLITPNDTDLVTPTASKLKDVTSGYSSAEYVVNGSKRMSPTRNMEIMHNLSAQQTNSVAKDALGIAAVHNKFNPVFAMSGTYLPATYYLNRTSKTDKKTGEITDTTYYFRNKLLMPHNTTEDGNITLGNLTAQDGNDISEVLSQLLNGWLDAAKDDFIFYLRGNKELTPVLTFLVSTGVPIETAAYFLSQPLIKEYVENLKQRNGALSSVFGKKSGKFQEAKDAFKDVISNPVNGFTGTISTDMKPAQINETTVNLTKADVPNGFQLQDLEKVLEDYNHADKVGNIYQPTKYDRAAFLHFIEIVGMEDAITKVKRSMNFDTDLKQTFFEMAKKETDYKKMVMSERLSPDVVRKITQESPLGAYRVNSIAKVFEDKLFPLVSTETVNDFISENVKAGDLFEDVAAAQKAFKQDLVSYIFQNEIRKFDKTSDRYKDLKLDDAAIAKDFAAGVQTTKEYNERGLVAVNKNAITTVKEFEHFVYEREALRELYPLESIQEFMDYKSILEIQEKNPSNVKEDGTNTAIPVAYEQFLRNRALTNIYNPWQLFKSHTSVADTFLLIKKMYPNLNKQYPLLQNLVFDDTGKAGYRNLRLSTTKLTKVELEVFHENLTELANKFVGEGNDTQFVREFFTKFPYFAMMQTGTSLKGKFAMGRIAPYTNFLALMSKPVDDFKANATPELLGQIYAQFIVQNSNRGQRVRSKNYLAGSTEPISATPEVIQEEKKIVESPQPSTEQKEQKDSPKPLSDNEQRDKKKDCE